MAGYFGKLPGTGDFVAAGLGAGVRAVLDRWISAHLAGPARTPEIWPEGGLVAVIEGAGAPLLLLVLPSRDSAGRAFPLAAVTPLGEAGHDAAEAWATAAFGPLVDAADNVVDAATLGARLAAVPPPAQAGAPLRPTLVWAEKTAPRPPEEALPALLAPR